MKFSASLANLALLGIAQSLCPFAEQALRDPEYLKRHLTERGLPTTVEKPELPRAKRQTGPGGLPLTTFNEDQLIDVTGEHAWAPPGPGDLRGPCPGLNALANHGYFPRNGIVPLATGALATEEVYGQ